MKEGAGRTELASQLMGTRGKGTSVGSMAMTEDKGGRLGWQTDGREAMI